MIGWKLIPNKCIKTLGSGCLFLIHMSIRQCQLNNSLKCLKIPNLDREKWRIKIYRCFQTKCSSLTVPPLKKQWIKKNQKELKNRMSHQLSRNWNKSDRVSQPWRIRLTCPIWSWTKPVRRLTHLLVVLYKGWNKQDILEARTNLFRRTTTNFLQLQRAQRFIKNLSPIPVRGLMVLSTNTSAALTSSTKWVLTGTNLENTQTKGSLQWVQERVDSCRGYQSNLKSSQK